MFVIYLIGPSIHTCCALKRHLLALEGDKVVFASVLKPLIIQSPLSIGKDINFEASDDSPIDDREAFNLFCEEVLFVYLV